MTSDFEVKIGLCYRKNLCIDCDNTRCGHCGQILADCPKYRCDRPPGFIEDCETCEFLQEYQKDMREYYGSLKKAE